MVGVHYLCPVITYKIDDQLKHAINITFKLCISLISNIHKLCIVLNNKYDFKALFRKTLVSGLDMRAYGSQHHLQETQSERLTKEVGERHPETVSHDHSYITALAERNQGLLRWLRGKETSQCRRSRRCRFDP